MNVQASYSRIVPTFENELTEWEFDNLVKCRSGIAESMILNRVRVKDSKTSDTLENSLFEYLGINTREFYYIQRGYCQFTVYFKSIMDRNDFEKLVEKYAKKTQQ